MASGNDEVAVQLRCRMPLSRSRSSSLDEDRKNPSWQDAMHTANPPGTRFKTVTRRQLDDMSRPRFSQRNLEREILAKSLDIRSPAAFLPASPKPLGRTRSTGHGDTRRIAFRSYSATYGRKAISSNRGTSRVQPQPAHECAGSQVQKRHLLPRVQRAMRFNATFGGAH